MPSFLLFGRMNRISREKLVSFLAATKNRASLSRTISHNLRESTGNRFGVSIATPGGLQGHRNRPSLPFVDAAKKAPAVAEIL